MLKRSFLLTLLTCGLFIPPAANAQRGKKPTQKPPVKRKITVKKSPSAPAARPTNINRGDDTTIRSTTLEVYQVYKPEVKIAPKPVFTPTLPAPETMIVPQEYTVPQQALNYTYRSLPLRPLALGKDTAALPPSDYVKAGIGNLSTFYADAGIASLRGAHWQTAIHARHISQKGTISDQRFSNTGLDASGSLQGTTHLWQASLAADHRRYQLYGYDHNEFGSESARRLNYTSIDAKVGLQNNVSGRAGVDYKPYVRLNYFSGINTINETTIEAALPATKKLDSNLTLELGVHGIFTSYNADFYSGGNNIFSIKPGLSYRSGDVSAHLGLNPTFGRFGNAYLLPDITAAYQISAHLEVNAGWQARLVQNTFQQLSLKNPFFSVLYPLPQSRNDEVFVAASAGIGHHLSFGARFSWWQFNNLPQFVTYTGDSTGRMFEAFISPEVNALSLQLTARYELGESFSAGVSTAFYNYRNDGKTVRVWQEPSVRLNGDVRWKILKDLHANAYLNILSGLHGRDARFIEQDMENIVDVGAGAEYFLIPKLSIWANVGNLLNRPNQRWLGYDSFGINVYGGLRFRF